MRKHCSAQSGNARSPKEVWRANSNLEGCGMARAVYIITVQSTTGNRKRMLARTWKAKGDGDGNKQRIGFASGNTAEGSPASRSPLSSPPRLARPTTLIAGSNMSFKRCTLPNSSILDPGHTPRAAIGRPTLLSPITSRRLIVSGSEDF